MANVVKKHSAREQPWRSYPMPVRLNNKGATIMIHAHQTAPTPVRRGQPHPLRLSAAATTRTMNMPYSDRQNRSRYRRFARAWGVRAALALAAAAPRFSCTTGRGARKPTVLSRRYAKPVAARMP